MILQELEKKMMELKCDKCEIIFKRAKGNMEISRSKINNMDYCPKCSRSFHLAKRNISQTGKTFEELYGIEKAREIRQKMSKANSGENNANYGGKYSRFEGVIKWNYENLKGKTFEEAYGEEKAKEIKKKLSKANSGENNNMYGKPSPQGSGNGIKGWYKGIYFASLKELYYIKYLLDNNIKFENGEQRKYKVQYEFMNKTLNYFLDFYLPETDEYIEIKPKRLINSPRNTAKFEAAREKLGDKFKVLTEDDLPEISLEDLNRLYQDKIVTFNKKSEEKFIEYYEKHKS